MCVGGSRWGKGGPRIPQTPAVNAHVGLTLLPRERALGGQVRGDEGDAVFPSLSIRLRPCEAWSLTRT